MDAFLVKYDLRMEYPCKFAGYGSFSNKILKDENKIYVGEIVGFQDF